MEAALPKDHNPWLGPVFIFLFFFNTFLLPEGVTFSLLLTPVWLFILWKIQAGKHLVSLITLLLIYAMIHIAAGVVFQYYLISSILIWSNGIFAIMFAFLIRNSVIDIDGIFKKILLLNFLFTLLSLVIFWLPPLKPLVWYSISITDQVKIVSRLKLFTSEASHYSYLLTPIAIYYYCGALFSKIPVPWLALLMISIPLAFSLSFGVLGCLLFTGIIVMMVNFKRVFNTRTKRNILLATPVLLTLVAVLLFLFFPDNLLFVRIENILHGRDTSFRARTFESFILADKIAAVKSYWWGIGPGQLKILGRGIIIQFYYPYPDPPATIRIPNAMAETIISFGYLGCILRIGLQILLFCWTRVYSNPYRLWLFLFLFIFQFMGSYITNPAEYIFWVMAFSRLFNRFTSKESAP